MRALVTCRPLTGHYRPLLPLASALAASGHEVAFATADPVATDAESAGFTVFRAGLGPEARNLLGERLSDPELLSPARIRSFFFTELFVRIELEPRARDLLDIVDHLSPHIIVHEVAELAAPLVATARGLLYVDHGYGPALPSAVVADAAVAAAPTWAAHGLEPDGTAGLYRHLYLDPCPPRLQVVDAAAIECPTLRIQTADAPADDPPPPDVLVGLGGRALVYVTLGTIWNRSADVFRTILNGFVGEEVDVVVTVGAQNDPAMLGPQPPNVRVRRFVPQAQLLPYCSAVVTHAGSGSMLGALAHGLPLLVVPQGADQFSNAERIVAAGAGIALRPGELSASAVRESMRSLLGSTSYRDAARAIAAEIAALPPASYAVSALERLVDNDS